MSRRNARKTALHRRQQLQRKTAVKRARRQERIDNLIHVDLDPYLRAQLIARCRAYGNHFSIVPASLAEAAGLFEPSNDPAHVRWNEAAADYLLRELGTPIAAVEELRAVAASHQNLIPSIYTIPVRCDRE